MGKELIVLVVWILWVHHRNSQSKVLDEVVFIHCEKKRIQNNGFIKPDLKPLTSKGSPENILN